jgi:hypothetical protein
MNITDICEDILVKCKYNSTTYSNIDELNFIKYRIYKIFSYYPLGPYSNLHINDKTEDKVLKIVSDKVIEKYSTSSNNIGYEIKTALYDAAGDTEQKDDKLGSLTLKNTSDIYKLFENYLDNDTYKEFNKPVNTSSVLTYDNFYSNPGKVKYIKNATIYNKRGEDSLLNFVQYIYVNEAEKTESYWKWFYNHHIKRIQKLSKESLPKDIQPWYNKKFYILNNEPYTVKEITENFINAIKTFEFSACLISRYISTNGTSRDLKEIKQVGNNRMQIQLEKNNSTAPVLMTDDSEDEDDEIYKFKSTNHLFLSDKEQNEKGNKIKVPKASLKIYDEYLLRKVILANSPVDKKDTSDYSNINHFFNPNPLMLKKTGNYYISTYNIGQKNIKQYLGHRTKAKIPNNTDPAEIDKLKKHYTKNANNNSTLDVRLLKNPAVKINFFQEVNLHKKFKIIDYLKLDKLNFDKKIRENILKSNVIRFITDNKIKIIKTRQYNVLKKNTDLKDYELNFKKTEDYAYLKDPRSIWHLELPLYDVTIEHPIEKTSPFRKSGFFITNRLASFDKEDNVKKYNGFTFNKDEFDLENIKIGKLGISLDDHRTHIFIAIPSKDKHILYINIHLDTNDSDRKQQLELIFLLNKIIPLNSNKTYKKIIIAGDFNMDVFEIVQCITRVKNSYYKTKRFLVLNNNIITRAGNTLNQITSSVPPPPPDSPDPPDPPDSDSDSDSSGMGAKRGATRGVKRGVKQKPVITKNDKDVINDDDDDDYDDDKAGPRMKKSRMRKGGQSDSKDSEDSEYSVESSVNTEPDDDEAIKLRKKCLYASLDNCIIIEDGDQKKTLKTEYKPQILINTNTNGKSKTDKSDHSLVLFEIKDPELISTSALTPIFDPDNPKDFRISNTASNSISLSKELRKEVFNTIEKRKKDDEAAKAAKAALPPSPQPSPSSSPQHRKKQKQKQVGT